MVLIILISLVFLLKKNYFYKKIKNKNNFWKIIDVKNKIILKLFKKLKN